MTAKPKASTRTLLSERRLIALYRQLSPYARLAVMLAAVALAPTKAKRRDA
jgi:hypothetical protein